MANSINFNQNAAQALAALNYTNSQLNAVQKQISTGYAVADAFDNGAAFAIAQSLRSDMAAIAAVNGSLSAMGGLLQITNAAVTGVSDALTTIRSTLTQLSDPNVTGSSRTQLISQYSALQASVSNYIMQANYRDKNLISANSANVSVIQDVFANQYTVNAKDLTANVTNRLLGVSDSTGASRLLTGGFVAAQNFVGMALGSFSASADYISRQITFNSNVSDAITGGISALVDADMVKASAVLESLKVRQQLGVQSLGIANQQPQILLNLFNAVSSSFR